jgi:hypothetical protein
MIMNHLRQTSTVKVPITQRDRALAKQYAQGVNSTEAKRIYLNFLAVRAVEFYLNCLGIATNQKESDSYDSIFIQFFDTADLWIDNYGKIETRPLYPNETSCWLPPEVRFDRKAYFLVRLDDQLGEAEILGFTPIAQARITLEDLQSLSEFLALFNPSSEKEASRINCLGNWLKGRIEKGWQNLDSIFTQQQLTPSTVRHLSSPETEIKQAKIINLGVQLDSHEIVLVITIVPNGDEAIKVRVQAFPEFIDQYLPENFQLAMLSETGEVLQAVRARGYDNYIQLRSFRGNYGDRFDIQLGWNHVKVIESFVF